jgi:DNA-binding transcriptional ArsR family regulator
VSIFAVPKSSRRVLIALASSDSLNLTQLKEKTGLAERTLRFALARLKKEGLIAERVTFRDMRKRVFEISKKYIEQKSGLAELKSLVEHEEVNRKKLAKLEFRIKKDGILKKPIVVDGKTKMILDGHHRYNVFKRIGLPKIPVFFVDYLSDEVVVLSGKGKEYVSKRDVLKVIRKGGKFPSKSTRHFVKLGNNIVHVSRITPRIHFPIRGGSYV